MTVITAVNPKPSLDRTNSILPIERKKERERVRERAEGERESKRREYMYIPTENVM